MKLGKKLVVKHVPEEILQLRKRLEQFCHLDIALEAQKGQNFEECIGIIAAKLDIALDGTYDMPQLAAMLCEALDRRHTTDKHDPHKLAKGLIPAKIEEREDALRLEVAKLPAAKTAPQREVQLHNIFMLEQGCEICDDRAACRAAKKCLGKEEGFGRQLTD